MYTNTISHILNSEDRMLSLDQVSFFKNDWASGSGPFHHVNSHPINRSELHLVKLVSTQPSMRPPCIYIHQTQTILFYLRI